MQFALGTIILVGCSYVGYGLGTYYVKRHRFLVDLITFASQLKVEIGFANETLSQIVQKHIKEYDAAFTTLLRAYLRLLKRSEYITTKQLKNNLPLHYLEEVEQKQVLQFFNFLGKSDAKNQIEVIEKQLVLFQVMLNSAVEERKKYASIFKKLGFLVGVLILIVMI